MAKRAPSVFGLAAVSTALLFGSVAGEVALVNHHTDRVEHCAGLPSEAINSCVDTTNHLNNLEKLFDLGAVVGLGGIAVSMGIKAREIISDTSGTEVGREEAPGYY